MLKILSEQAKLNKRTTNTLAKKGIVTTDDLVRFVPRRYKNYSKVVTLKDAIIDKENAIQAHFMRSELDFSKKPGRYTIYLLDEESGTEFKAVWFGNTFVSRFYKVFEGQNVVVCGKLEYSDKYGYQMTAPDHVELSGDFIPKYMTIYPNIKGVSEQNIKTMLYNYLKEVDEPLEDEIYNKLNCIGYQDALYKLHYPKSEEDIVNGKKRLLADDLLYFSIMQKKNSAVRKEGFKFVNQKKSIEFVNNLPFPLTQGQKNVLNKAFVNAKHGIRNNMLVQGDVGCGKTVVAFTMMINAAENGYQACLIAPTKILATQHYEEFIAKTGEPTAFLHSKLKASERKAILKQIKNGEVKYIIGTHSVFNKDVEFNNLGIIITDEEHKFGVKQKEALKEKAEKGIHVITMSATPIPRSLAGVYFGKDKDICVIDTLPEGRIPVQTAIQKGHTNTFPFLYKQISAGHQAYVVCPAIESTVSEDEEEGTGLKNVEDVLKEYEAYFKPLGIKIGAVHGKMKKEDVAATIEAFSNNEIQILISTTVIEVGVNVPNATVMVIEQADRFGLASLHQLRGRVGRGKDKSYCILISDDVTNERLVTMTKVTNGFEIAEADLKLRGSGDLIGTKQSGFDKYVQMIIANHDFYEKIKEVADYCIKNNLGNGLIELYEGTESA